MMPLLMVTEQQGQEGRAASRHLVVRSKYEMPTEIDIRSGQPEDAGRQVVEKGLVAEELAKR